MSRPSPLANRCAPDGSLHAVAARGALMGNRGGRLHRADGTLGAARWRSRAWIACVTRFGDRRRSVWGDGYSEIFFLDEATALAAGHRPCFECRRADAIAFAAAWGRAAGTAPPRAPEMDRRLHDERRAPREPVAPAELPAGVDLRGRGAVLPADGRRGAGLGVRRLRAGARDRRRGRGGGGHAGLRAGGAGGRVPADAASERSIERAVGSRVELAGEAVAVGVEAVAVGLRAAGGEEGALGVVGGRGSGRSFRRRRRARRPCGRRPAGRRRCCSAGRRARRSRRRRGSAGCRAGRRRAGCARRRAAPGRPRRRSAAARASTASG